MATATFRSALVAITACAALSLAACSNPSHQGGARSAFGPRQDASALQGRWEQLPEEPGGSGTPRQRVVKEVSGNTETVTTYGPNGQVIQAQTATFRLSRSGPVNVYTIENTNVTQGAGQGRAASQAPMRYVYRVHGNEFDEVWGLLPGQEEREVIVKRWRRAGTGR